jgi:hypothetical protein
MTKDEMTRFEGQVVDGYEMMFRQYRGPIDIPLTSEEIVHLKVTARVKDVGHKTNERNGLFIRHHELKVLDVEVVDK